MSRNQLFKSIGWLLLSTLLFSCSKGDGRSELSFGTWDKNMLFFYEEIFAEYEAANPHVKISIELTPWSEYWTKLEAAASGGVLPDIFWMNMLNIEKYVRFGILENLSTALKESSINFDNYLDILTESYHIDGSQYGIPLFLDSIGLYYHKGVLDQAGVSYPTGVWSWEELLDAAEKVKQNIPEVYPLLIIPDFQEGFYPMILSNGGSILTEDKRSGYFKEENREALILYREAIERGLIPAISIIDQMEVHNTFQAEKVAFMFHGSWNLVTYSKVMKENLGTAELPSINGKRGGVLHGLAYVVSSKTKEREEALKLLEFMSSREKHQLFGSTGISIPAFKGTEESWEEYYKETFNIDASPFVSMLPYSEKLPASLYSTRWKNMEREEIKRYLSGQQDIDTTVKTIETRMNETLDQENL